MVTLSFLRKGRIRDFAECKSQKVLLKELKLAANLNEKEVFVKSINKASGCFCPCWTKTFPPPSLLSFRRQSLPIFFCFQCILAWRLPVFRCTEQNYYICKSVKDNLYNLLFKANSRIFTNIYCNLGFSAPHGIGSGFGFLGLGLGFRVWVRVWVRPRGTRVIWVRVWERCRETRIFGSGIGFGFGNALKFWVWDRVRV